MPACPYCEEMFCPFMLLFRVPSQHRRVEGKPDRVTKFFYHLCRLVEQIVCVNHTDVASLFAVFCSIAVRSFQGLDGEAGTSRTCISEGAHKVEELTELSISSLRWIEFVELCTFDQG